MEIQFQRTFADYKEAIASQRKRSFTLRAVAVRFGIVLVLYTVSMFVLVQLGIRQAEAAVYVTAGSLILMSGYSLGFSSWLKRDLGRHPNFVKPVTMRITETGVHSESEAWNGETSWSAYVKSAESENLCLLYLGARLVDVIPKRAFSAEQLEDFRQLAGARFGREEQTR